MVGHEDLKKEEERIHQRGRRKKSVTKAESEKLEPNSLEEDERI